MVRPLALALALVACGGPSPEDGGLDAATRDAGSSGTDASTCVAGGSERIVDLGHCFDARTCCTAADCGGDRTWLCNADGLCEEDGRLCTCVTDLDCSPGDFCFTNAVVCGICAPTRPPCTTDATCGTSGRCADGYCVDDTACMGYPEP